MVKCKICNEKVSEIGIKNGYTIGECEYCEFQFVLNLPDHKTLSSLYQDQKITKWDSIDLNKTYKNFLESNNNPKRDFFDALIQLVQENTRKNNLKILEIGSGRSDLVFYANSINHDSTGIEANIEVVNYLNKIHKGKIKYLKNDNYDDLTENTYDFIYLEHALEHFLDINKLFGSLNKLLKENGVIAILVPNHNSTLSNKFKLEWSEYCPPFHLSFFKPKSISMLLEKYGYNILKVEEKSYYFRSVWQNYSIDKFINRILSIFRKVVGVKYLKYPYTYPKTISEKIRLIPWILSNNVGEELFIVAQKK